jgi:3-(3-hydroxy-phenyl)propionate hydroxylase
MIAQDISQLAAAKHWHDPILIAGANPVGLITALGLARYKIPCVVLEEGAGASLESSQVALLDATTLSILDAWGGVGQLILSQGIIPDMERVFLRKTSLYSTTLPAHVPGMSYPRLVMLHHAALEQLLLQALQQAGGSQVLWQHRVKGFASDIGGIDVELESPTGQKFLRAPYLLCTSEPSNTPGITPDGGKVITTDEIPAAKGAAEMQYERYLSVDVLVEMETPRERWVWFDAPCNPGRLTQVFSLPGGLVRLLYQLGPRDDLGAMQQAEALRRRVDMTLGKRSYEVIAVSSHARKRGAIAHFRNGRAIFLGSAAHHVALFGASEVNSGALDAWNLAWKLALVRAGLALEELLDTYHDERHNAILEGMKSSEAIRALIAPGGGIAKRKRNAMLRLSKPFKSARETIILNEPSGATSSIASSDSQVFSEDQRLYLGGPYTGLSAGQKAVLKRFRQGPRVGMLAPSMALPEAYTGAVVPLLGRVSSGFLALCFTSDIDMAMNVLRRIPVELAGIPTLFYLISPTAPVIPTGEDVTILVDADGHVARAYNAGQRTLYLVRPDGIIAARRFDSDFNDIPALLRHAIGEDVVDSQLHVPRLKRSELTSSG